MSVSAVSLVMKSMKDWKVTVPCPLGSTKDMILANSASPFQRIQNKQKKKRKKRKGHRNQSLTAHTSHEPTWGRGYKVSKASYWLRNINVTVSEIWDLKWLPLFCKMALVLLKKILFVPNTQYFPSINFLQLLLFPILILVKLVLTLHFSPPS